MFIVVLLLVYYQNEMLPRILSRATSWTKAHQLNGLEIEERGPAIWPFLRSWDGDTFRRVSVGVLDQFESDVTREVFVVGSMVATVGVSRSVAARSGGSEILAVTYVEYLGSGYKGRLID